MCFLDHRSVSPTMKAATLLLFLTVVCGFQVARPGHAVNIQDGLNRFKDYVRNTRHDVDLKMLAVLADSIQIKTYTQNILWLQRDATQESFEKGLSTELSRIYEHVEAEKSKGNNVEHCYTRATKSINRILQSATLNFKICGQMDDTYRFVDNKFREMSQEIIEDLSNIFPTCFVNFNYYTACLFVKIEHIKPKLEQFNQLYDSSFSFRRRANEQVLGNSVQCFHKQYKKSREDLIEILMSITKCMQSP